MSPPAATNNMYIARGLRARADFTSREKTGVDKAAAVIEVRRSAAVLDCGVYWFMNFVFRCVLCAVYGSPTSRRAKKEQERVGPERAFVPFAYIIIICLCCVFERACVRFTAFSDTKRNGMISPLAD